MSWFRTSSIEVKSASASARGTRRPPSRSGTSRSRSSNVSSFVTEVNARRNIRAKASHIGWLSPINSAPASMTRPLAMSCRL